MPQIFQVLKCFKCLIFQVHLTKKSPKWECKICGEKQSIKRHYGIGTAQECRGHVQRLNTMQGGKNDSSSILDVDSEDEEYTQTYNEKLKLNYTQNKNKRVSKWSAFIDDDEDMPNDSTETEHNDSTEVVLELPKNQKLKMAHKNAANSDDGTKTIYLNKKTCYQMPNNVKQCSDSLTKQSKWSAYTIENENVPNDNEYTNCNRNIYSDKINSKKNEEEIGGDFNQFNQKTVLNLNTKHSTVSETTANAHTRDFYKNSANSDDPIIIKNNKLDIKKEQGSKWSQFIYTDYPQNLQSDVETNQNLSDNKGLFSLCDDKDIDSILDF